MGIRHRAILGSALSAARFVAAFALLPAAFFAVAAHWLYLVRPTFNLDYLVVGALLPRLGRRGTALMLGAALANDVVCSAAPACNFTLPDFLRSLRHIDVIAPWALLLLLLALATVGALFAWVVLRSSGPVPWPRVAVGAAAVLAGIDLAQGGSLVLPSSAAANSGVATTLVALIREPLRQLPSEPSAPPHHRQPTPTVAIAPVADPPPTSPPAADAPSTVAVPYRARSAAAGLLAVVQGDAPLPKHNLVLVLVESLGELRDDDAAALLLRPLTQLSARYRVETGAVPFGGATMRGELRELCGADFDGDFDERPVCLPAALAKRGYRTIAMHGFTRSMYDRSRWYPRAGFQRTLFIDELRGEGVTRTCGSVWRGLCDTDVADRLDHELRASTDGTPRFIYWMTLNSHLPETDAFDSAAFDCAATAPTRDGLVCVHARALSVALSALARVAADPALPPTDFIIVGDHAPPFPGRAQRQAFDAAHVPYVTLSWRG